MLFRSRTDGDRSELGTGRVVDVGVLSEPVDDLGVGCVELVEKLARGGCVTLGGDQDERVADVRIDVGEERRAGVCLDKDDTSVRKVGYDETPSVHGILESFVEDVVGPAVDPVGQIAKVLWADEVGIVLDREGRAIEADGVVEDSGCVTTVMYGGSIRFSCEWVSAMALMSENNQGDEANSRHEFLY